MTPVEIVFLILAGSSSVYTLLDTLDESDKNINYASDDDSNDDDGDDGDGGDGSIVQPPLNIKLNASDFSDGVVKVQNVTDDANYNINGGDGDDIAYTGNGDDIIFSGNGDDSVFTGGGDDTVYLQAGNDFLDGSIDINSQRYASDGSVLAHGGKGNDFLNSYDGSVVFHGELGNDSLVAIDSLNGGDEIDTLYGGWGNDFIAGDDGDIMYGGNGGKDVFVVLPYSADDDPVYIRDFGLFSQEIDLGAAENDHGEKIIIHLDDMIKYNQLNLDPNNNLTDSDYFRTLNDEQKQTMLDGKVTQQVVGDDLHISVNGNVVTIVEGQSEILTEEYISVEYGRAEDLL